MRLNKKLDPMEHGVLVNNGLCLPMILIDFGMLVFFGYDCLRAQVFGYLIASFLPFGFWVWVCLKSVT